MAPAERADRLDPGAEQDTVEKDRLAEIIADAWLVRAPVLVAKQWLAERGLD